MKHCAPKPGSVFFCLGVYLGQIDRDVRWCWDLETAGFVARDLMAFDLPLTLSPLDIGEFPRRELSLSSRKILLAFFFFFGL